MHYIKADGKTIAILVKETNQPDKMYYIHTDHLGSYDVITDNAGNVVDRLSFDAWGNRRDARSWTRSPTQIKKSYLSPFWGELKRGRGDLEGLLFTRGFTGHEHLDKFGVINMNGRIYDPMIGRFFSPDPFVQMPTSTQGFNRYSYCMNNPLMYTDPNGEWFLSIFCPPLVILDMALWSATIDAGIQGMKIASGGQEKFNWAQTAGAFVGGAISGGLAYGAPLLNINNIQSLGWRYLAKASYAGLTSSLSTLGAEFVSAIGNGTLQDDGVNILKNAGIAFLPSFGMSLLSSGLQYLTWDKYSPEQKLAKISAKFPDAKFTYDPTSKDFAMIGEDGAIQYGPKGLVSKAVAYNTAAHEWQHIEDVAQGLPTGQPYHQSRFFGGWYNEYQTISERNAHLLDIRQGPSQWLPMAYTKQSIFFLKYEYGYSGSIPHHWRVITTLLNLYY